MKTYWQHVNLPLALHAYGNSSEPSVRELLESLLRALDGFCAQFGHLPGARSLLAPLWKNAWQDTPESVVDRELRLHRALLRGSSGEPVPARAKVGVVAEVAVLSINDISGRDRTNPRTPCPLPGTENQFWVPLRLVGVRSPDLQFILDGL